MTAVPATSGISRRTLYAAWLFVVCAAVSFRVQGGFGPFKSVSVFDLVIAVSVPFLAIRAAASGNLQMGHRGIFFCLFVPVLVAVLSLTWVSDFLSAIRWLVPYFFALSAYLVAVTLFGRLPSRTLMRMMAAFVLLSLLTCALAYASVPGFGFFIPDQDTMARGDYLSRIASSYSRLSHPFIGLSNDFAAVLSFFVFPLAVWAWLRRSPGFAAIACVAVAAVILTFSRGSITALVLFGGLLLLRVAGVQVTVLTGALALGSVALAALVLSGVSIPVAGRVVTMDSLLHSRMRLATIEHRVSYYQLAVSSIQNRPWLGYGIGGTEYNMPGYRKLAVHNTYLQQALFFGIPLGGLVSLALMGLPVAFFQWHLRSRAAGIMATAIGFGLCAELLSFVAESTLEATVPRILLHAAIGMSVALVLSMEAEGAGGVDLRGTVVAVASGPP